MIYGEGSKLGKLRRIVVEDEVYFWKYRYDDYDYCLPSYLLILSEKYKGAEIRIKFPLIDKPIDSFMLNSGFKAMKNGEEVIINLNEPKYVAEFIRYLLKNGVDFQKKAINIFNNGEELFEEMGYSL